MKRSIALSLVALLVTLMNVAITPVRAFRQESTLYDSAARARFSPPEAAESGRLVLYARDGGLGCREATAEEGEILSLRDPDLILHPISHTDSYSLSGREQELRIVLRATAQLERFPQAKEGFLKAAAIWEDKIQTPISIAIDVDYGPTNFGISWGFQQLGASYSQDLTSSNVYSSVRAQLIAGASDDQEASVFNSLPVGSVPTDIGSATAMAGPLANARALGLLDPVADPDGRERDLGKPPSIAFNSNAKFDFDPSDGIDSDKVDFEAVAVHEIGHVLGFISRVGVRDLDSKAAIAPSVWDLYRLRPGVVQDGFSTAQRVLSAGGEQVYTLPGLEVPLSTARNNRTGGDGGQASHWKNDSLINNRYIGVMEVGIPFGARQVMTSFDLLAIKMMGYRLKPGVEIAPEIGDFGGRMQSDVLTITGRAANIGAGAIYAEVKILDESGGTIIEYPLAAVDSGDTTIADFAVRFSGIDQWRAASQASLTLLDGQGNRGTKITEGILKGDSGGPSLSSLSFNGSVLKIKGKRLSGQISLEVNAAVVPVPDATVKGSGKKVQAKASAAQLQLSGGPNRVRVISNGLRSNAVILIL